MTLYSYDFEKTKLTIAGDKFGPIIDAYLRGMGLISIGGAKRTKKTVWYHPNIQPNEVETVVAWLKSRGVEIEKGNVKASVKLVRKQKSRATYTYTNPKPWAGETKSTVQLRGGGLQQSNIKAYLIQNGFRWTFAMNRRRVMAYQAEMGVLKLIEILQWLQRNGLTVDPSTALPAKKWLYLDKPKEYEVKKLKTGETLSVEDFSVWLEANNYSRLTDVEQPGDFAPKGDTVFVWTKEDDELIRLCFDGDTIESIAKVDPETYEADFTPEYVVCGLREINAAEVATAASEPMAVAAPPNLSIINIPKQRPPKPRPAPKYVASRVTMMTRSLTKLDKDHPFFNMVKWNNNPTN